MTILENCHRAMRPGARLRVVEMIIPPGNAPSVAKLLDLEMRVITGGRERTETAFKRLIDASDFRMTRVFPTPESVCMIEAIRL